LAAGQLWRGLRSVVAVLLLLDPAIKLGKDLQALLLCCLISASLSGLGSSVGSTAMEVVTMSSGDVVSRTHICGIFINMATY
jgi:hypothetical protein